MSHLKVSPSVSVFDLDDQLVIYAAHDSTTYVLNPTAAFVWKHLGFSRSAATVATSLAQSFGVSEEVARRDVGALITEWLENGLIGGNAGATSIRREYTTLSLRLRSPAKREPRLEEPAHRATFRLLDFFFQIGSSEGDIIDEVRELLVHLKVPPPVGSELPIRLFINEAANGWQLLEETVQIASCGFRENLIPLIYTYVSILSYLRSSSFAAIHGAAVSDGKRCVLMPGRSGYGKSTLAAGLVGAGLHCCTDDMAVLTAPPIRLRPLPMRIAVKEGSWAQLERAFPELDNSPVYTRPDGRRVKYLRQPTELSGKDTPMNVTHLVFPRFSVQASNSLEPLPRAAAFSELASAGYDLPAQISSDWIRAITEWLGGLSCYELHFNDLDVAVAEVAGLLS